MTRALPILLSLFTAVWTGDNSSTVPLRTKMSRCDIKSDKEYSIYDFEVEDLEGFTKQYLDFNPILEQFNDRNFKILAFPSNQFGMQEPGKNYELLNGLKYVRPGGGWEPGPNLHIFGKLKVNGDAGHPMYKMFKTLCPATDPLIAYEGRTMMFWDEVTINDLVWNFEKFLIDRQGRPRYRFHPSEWNNGTSLTPFIETLVAETGEEPVQEIIRIEKAKCINKEGQPNFQ